MKSKKKGNLHEQKDTKGKDDISPDIKEEGVVTENNDSDSETDRLPLVVNTREKAKEMSRAARQIARANGKRITMAMFFIEDL